jgi:hypothetical protein
VHARQALLPQQQRRNSKSAQDIAQNIVLPID